MKAFWADPQGFAPTEFEEAALMVVELASGRAWATPMQNRRGEWTDTRDLCYRINSVENNYEEAIAIVSDAGWCIFEEGVVA